MDPKQNTQLDPKLQEAYNRVMGTDTSVPHDPTQPATPPTTTPVTTPPPADPGSIQMPAASDTPAIPPAPPTMPTDPTQSTPSDNTPPIIPSTPQMPSTQVVPDPTSPTPPTPQVPQETPAQPAAPAPQVPDLPEVPTQEVKKEPETVHFSSTTSLSTSAKSKTKISPIILILGAVIFLVAYALIWIKVFGLQIPFLPQ